MQRAALIEQLLIIPEDRWFGRYVLRREGCLVEESSGRLRPV